MFSFSGILIWCTRQHGHLATPQRNFFWLWHQDTTTIADLIFVKIKNCVCVLILGLNREKQLCNDDSTTFFWKLLLEWLVLDPAIGFIFQYSAKFPEESASSNVFPFPMGGRKDLWHHWASIAQITEEKVCLCTHMGSLFDILVLWHQCGFEFEQTSLHRLGYFVWYTPNHNQPY